MNRLAETRSRLGLTQESLARAARISLRYVQGLEADQSSPSVPIAQRIAAVLHEDISVIWPPEDAPDRRGGGQ